MLTAVLLLAQEKGAEPNPLVSFLPLLLIMAAFIFLIVLPARRRERLQRESLFGALKKNDEVLTSGGIIGIVANISPTEDEVTLKVDESSNLRIRVLKSSIVRIMNTKEQPKDGAAKATDTNVKAGPPN